MRRVRRDHPPPSTVTHVPAPIHVRQARTRHTRPPSASHDACHPSCWPRDRDSRRAQSSSNCANGRLVRQRQHPDIVSPAQLLNASNLKIRQCAQARRLQQRASASQHVTYSCCPSQQMRRVTCAIAITHISQGRRANSGDGNPKSARLGPNWQFQSPCLLPACPSFSHPCPSCTLAYRDCRGWWVGFQ